MIIIQLQAWLPTLIIILTCSNLLNKTSINFEILKTLKNVACTTWTDNIPNITIKKKHTMVMFYMVWKKVHFNMLIYNVSSFEITNI